MVSLCWIACLSTVAVSVDEPPASGTAGWPAEVGAAFPDLPVVALDGTQISLATHRGRVLLVEPIGTSCKACQAFSGGNEKGGIDGVAPQADLTSIDGLLDRYAEVALTDDRLELVQVLLYGADGRSVPTADEHAAWVDHFGVTGTVYRADPATWGEGVRQRIPGFWLVDHEGVLRFDAAGNRAPNQLYRELLPAVDRLVAAVPEVSR